MTNRWRRGVLPPAPLTKYPSFAPRLGCGTDALLAQCEQMRFHFMTSQPVLLMQAALDLAFLASPVFPKLAVGYIVEGLRAFNVALQQQGNKAQPVRRARRASRGCPFVRLTRRTLRDGAR